MAQPKKKWVAFRSNATVPADVLGKDEDVKVQAGEPIQLPTAYAEHVVADGFADWSDAAAKKKPAKADPSADLKVQLSECKDDVARLAGDVLKQDVVIADLRSAAREVFEPLDTANTSVVDVQTRAEPLRKLLRELDTADAESLVDSLNAELASMSEGDDGWADLTAKLDEAVTALAELKPAE